MDLLSTSNVVYDAMYDLISNNANAIGSIIIGILTGVISMAAITAQRRATGINYLQRHTSEPKSSA